MNDLKQRLEAMRETMQKVGLDEDAEALNYLLDVLFPYWEEMEDSVEELIGRMRMIDNELENRVTQNFGRKLRKEFESTQII